MAPLSALASFPWFDPSLSADARAEALVNALTPYEKTLQLATNFGAAPAPAVPRLGLPSYNWRSNAIHGLADNGVSTQFPQAIGLGATWDPEKLFLAGMVIGVEQRAKHNIQTGYNDRNDSSMDHGLNLWGPNINMFRDPRWGRGQETYGEDPVLTGALGSAMIRGMQWTGNSTHPPLTTATAKHFVAYSLDRSPPRLEFDPKIDEGWLRSYYLPAFKSVVDAGVSSIMCSYNGVNGYPMCASPMIQSVLRGEWGFKGYVASDSGALSFFLPQYHNFSQTGEEAAAAGLNAGVDLNSGSTYISHLNTSLAMGLVNQSSIDKAAARLFKSRISLGMFDPRERLGPLAHLGEEHLATPEHLALALELAIESQVLLRNDGVLPLDPKKKLAVVGPNANSTGVLMGNYYGCSAAGTTADLDPRCNVTTPLAGLATYVEAHSGPSPTYARGVDVESNSTTGIAAAVAAAKEADVVVAVLGLTNCMLPGGAVHRPNCESEGHDREDLGLPGEQEELLKALRETGKPVVVVLVQGGPVAPSPAALLGANATLVAWYGGSKAGTALAHVLFGHSPSGRLPVSIPQSVTDLPPDTAMNLDAAPHGRTYRFFNATPAFSFGFGASYTKFVYRHPAVRSTVGRRGEYIACVELRNDGHVPASEIVQIYGVVTGTREMFVPKVQLVAFKRVHTMKPGEERIICIPFGEEALQNFDAKQRKMKLMPMTLYIGGRGPHLQGAFVGGVGVPQEPLAVPLPLAVEVFV
mmetsp:Transcript_23832/g.54202  ORF Transcript_23832/g.54202 Transcript_23832/m.54202 type:complete len:752 (-) Transcript_23832:113-2368(-)